MRNTKIEFGFYLALACSLLLFPLRLIIAWLFAVVIHEAFHYFALRAYKVKVNIVKVTTHGILMETGPIGENAEMFCALAGPIGGFLLLLLRRQMPYTAICGFVQSCYNLLPIPPLDGGRVLLCLLARLKHRKIKFPCKPPKQIVQ